MLPVAILAGGKATRMQHISLSKPKSVVNINGEPFIAHQLRLLRSCGLQDVVLCVGHLGEQIVEVVGNGHQFGMRISYSFDGPIPLGTGGAIKRALDKLPDSFFVLYGDSYLECDYRLVQEAFKYSSKEQQSAESGVSTTCEENSHERTADRLFWPEFRGEILALMTVYLNEDSWDKSNVEIYEDHLVTYDKQERTSRMKYIDYGLGVFKRTAFDTVPDDCSYDLATLYQEILDGGQLAAYEIKQRFYEIGSPTGLRDLKEHLSGKPT